MCILELTVQLPCRETVQCSCDSRARKEAAELRGSSSFIVMGELKHLKETLIYIH